MREYAPSQPRRPPHRALGSPESRPTLRAAAMAFPALLLGLGTAIYAASAPPKAPTLADGDRYYGEQSYGRALAIYERLLRSEAVPAERRDEVGYRIPVALAKSAKWDRALEKSIEFVKAHRGTVWEPRGLYWLGRTYLAAAHEGYRAGGRIYRGSNVPPTDAAAVRVILEPEDLRNALDAFEAAHALFPAYRSDENIAADEIQLNFDLVSVLMRDLGAWAASQKWLPPADPSWQIRPTEAYSAVWPAPRKQLFLFEEIRALSLASPARRHSAALALLGKALWLQHYQTLMRGAAVRREGEKEVRIPYPYEDLKPEEPLRELARDFPGDPVRDQAQLAIGTILQQRGDLVGALAEFRRLIRERPGSPWVSDAGASVQAILRRSLSIDVARPRRPGDPARLAANYRNLAKVHLEAYRVPLETVLARTAPHAQPESQFTDFRSVFGDLRSARRFYGPRVAAWDAAIRDPGDHGDHQQVLSTPLRQAGAYVVEASAPGLRCATLALVTRLVLLQKAHRDGVLFFAADATTGAPVAGAQLLVKQAWYQGQTYHARLTRGRTDARGLYNLLPPQPRGATRDDIAVSALAYRSGSYALTEGGGGIYEGGDGNPFKAYAITDRSVYRPQQTVHFRILLMQPRAKAAAGEQAPLTSRRVRISVRDPNGQAVCERAATSNEFGSVHGDFELPEGAPLGEYRISVGIDNRQPETGAGQFRVEEYRKPEFEVAVTPAAERVRLGEAATARVSAQYYFGGPVQGAKVTYRVRRSPHFAESPLSRPYDFLYGSPSLETDGGPYRAPRIYARGGGFVAQGETRTDERGEGIITFPTGPAPGDEEETPAFTYTVEADVQDASRRVISGSGSVNATRHDVAVFLQLPRGYAAQNERVDLEVATVNASGQPVAAAGTVRVYRATDAPATAGAKPPTPIYEEPLKTDGRGRAVFRWTPNTSGRFRIAFETRDATEAAVRGEAELWVQGPDLEQGRVRYQQVHLAARDPYNEEGQTAKVLLVTPAPDCSVLLIREADGAILERRIVRVRGCSLEVDVPLSRRDVPNVFLSAQVVRGGKVYQASEEIRVPPARRFAALTVAPDRERYRPGEKATLRLRARDWQGRPLRAELSVAVSDASLTYIQAVQSPDIRLFFHGDRRYEGVPAFASTETVFQRASLDTQPWKKFALHRWKLPAGMGRLPAWPGAGSGWTVQSLLAYRSSLPARAAIHEISMGLEPGWSEGYRPARAAAPVAGRMAASAAPPAMPARMNGVPPGWLDTSSTPALAAGSGRRAGEPLAEARVRTNFADTAFWIPAVVTDDHGNATVEFTWPDNLTRWRAAAAGVTTAAQVGAVEAEVTTKKDLLLRVESPRFFVERDLVVVSASVHNYLPHDTRARVQLEAGGSTAEVERDGGGWLDVPKDGEKRVDWTLHILREGDLRLRMTAQTTDESDAAEMVFPVLVHGVERAITRSGALRDRVQEQVTIELPRERKPGSSEVVVTLNPSLAATMLDALPYLADYPYGCVEQTMSRFLPSVVVGKTLKEAGYDLEALGRRARLLEELERGRGPEHPTLITQHSPYTYPGGGKRSALRRGRNPVFDSHQLRTMILASLGRLRQFQHGDGGWGWWPDDSSDPYMTAYVVDGLLTCRQAGQAVEDRMLGRGLRFLRDRFPREEDLHRLTYEARVLAMDPASRKSILPVAAGRLYDRRGRLGVYARALLALALHDLGEADKAAVLLRNLESVVQVDEANGTANWGGDSSDWWHWYNDKVETNAAVLEAYVAIDPNDRLAPMLMKWLVNNRQGSAWNSTRETALAVNALAAYARAHRELDPEYTVTVELAPPNAQTPTQPRIRRQFTITRENALFFDNQFVLPDELLRTGHQTLTITRDGAGTLYWTATTRYFSLEEPLRATASQIAVRRRYFRLLPAAQLPTPGTRRPPSAGTRTPNPFLTGQYELLTQGIPEPDVNASRPVQRWKRVAIGEGEPVASGDLLEVELYLEAKNDYEYLVFEDPKPAGCEPVELRSGGHGGAGLYSYMELRDQKVAFFLSSLPQGTRTITYQLRAEAPGQFHVLPTNGYAMYAPAVRALSDEARLEVRE
jgi:uncharacterized protein YfaS (alpha-2-macroglobulin family)/tetratricopeptide (TPR) repeat protein